MMGRPKFDEVMIVNPSNGNINSDQRVRLMRFHDIYPPGVSGFAQPYPNGYYAPQAYGYYEEQPALYGYYGQDPVLDPTYGYYGDVDPNQVYGYYGQDPNQVYGYGLYGEEPQVPGAAWEGYGYGQYVPATYPEPAPVGYYADEVPIYNQSQAPMGYYGYAPETAGYSEPQPYEYPSVGYYGEPQYSGYAREVPPPFNAGCPLPTNVSGFDDGFAGYARPATVNPSCDQFTEQPGSPAAAPDTFRPLW
jgi:hypothetical protein